MHAISNPLSPGNGDLRVVLSGHFCASLHVGHARSIRPVFDYRITGVEAQIKTKTKKKQGTKASSMMGNVEGCYSLIFHEVYFVHSLANLCKLYPILLIISDSIVISIMIF